MDAQSLQIGLAAWIIRDGSYSDFECGRVERFALEFFSPAGLRRATDADLIPSLIHLREGLYTGRGVVRACLPWGWVVDFGPVLAFDVRKPPRGVRAGTVVVGEVTLGVDPLFGSDGLLRAPRVPPLVYEWHIDRIELWTAPIARLGTAQRDRAFPRDAVDRAEAQLTRTDAWSGDLGSRDYVLTCRRTSSAASRTPDNRPTRRNP